MLEWILEKQVVKLWIGFILLALVNIIMNLWVL